jgi:hypothetical protein
VSPRQKPLCRAECNKAPSTYEMEGALLWPRRPRSASCPASPALRAARRGRTPVRCTGFPAHSHVSGVAPGWCPFPTVKAFLPASGVFAQGSGAVHFWFFLCPHDVHSAKPLIRTGGRLSTGLCTGRPQLRPHRFTRRGDGGASGQLRDDHRLRLATDVAWAYLEMTRTPPTDF